MVLIAPLVSGDKGVNGCRCSVKGGEEKHIFNLFAPLPQVEWED